jgi:hypothetical protein
MKKDKTIVFLAYENRDLITYPTVINSAKSLLNYGYHVIILIPDEMNTKFSAKNLEIVTISKNNFKEYVTNAKRYLLIKTNIFFAIAFYFEGLAALSQANNSLKIPVPYVYISQELIYRRQLAVNKKIVFNLRSWIRLAYFRVNVSFNELFNLADDLNGLKQRLGDLEIDVNHTLFWIFSWYQFQLQGKFNAVALIAQDIKRIEILTKEIGWNKKTLELPNSYLGFNSGNSKWAYTRFNIPFDKKIILYIGSVERGFDLSLFDIADKLGQDQILFMQCLSRDNYINEIIPKYFDLITRGHLVVNDTLLDDACLDQLVQSSNICIGWYHKIPLWDENMYYVGYSSGKICKYLSCGKPVIVPSYLSDYKELVENKGIGLTCRSALEIPSAIKRIENNYASFASEVDSFYQSQLEFGTKFRSIEKIIKSFYVNSVLDI